MLTANMLTLVENKTRHTFNAYTNGAIVRALGVNKNLMKPINIGLRNQSVFAIM